MSNPTLPETMRITARNSTGLVPFVIRILRKGDAYGLNHALTHDDDRPTVEVYDARYDHTPFGQFVSRYFAETLLGLDGYGSGEGGLDLLTYEPSWKIDAATMTVVRAWISHALIAGRA